MKCSPDDRRRARLACGVFLAAIGAAACGRTASLPRPAVTATPPSRVPAIIPAPLTVEERQGPGFTVTASTVIYVQPDDERAAAIGRYLSDVIGLAASATPVAVHSTSSGVPPGNISLRTRGGGAAGRGGSSDPPEESYELTVRPDGVTLEGEGAAGLFYAVQTLRQLMPAFVEDLAAYAQARFITIVPEIDMPGHTNAALASYAELNCDGVARRPFTGIEVGFSALCVDQEVTYRFVDDVVREIAALTPGAYFHVGGDEVKTLTPEQYARFIERVQGIVTAHGKTMIGWDETAATNLLPSSIVQHWRPKTTPQEAVAKGTKVILSPADKIYLDMKYDAATAIGLTWAGRIDVRDAYVWEPATELAGVPESAILGVEAPLWSETIANIRDVEFLAFPRIVAVAEIGWSPADRRDWESFRERLGAHGPRWTALGVNFYRSPQVPWKN